MKLLSLILRSILAFSASVALARISGKKHASHLTFFDYISAATIGSIVGSIVDDSMNITSGFAVLFIWVFLTIGLDHITLTGLTIRKIVDGQPTVVVHKGKIMEQNMAGNRYNIDDLMLQLRNQGIFDINEVEFGVMETNGQLSILRKDSSNKKGLQRELIVNGEIIENNLVKTGVTRDWLFEQLIAQGINSTDDVVLATIGSDKKLYIDKKSDQN